MITNTGKYIMAKYMVGQTPSYASYIAIGCGSKPLTTLSFNITNKAMASGVVTLTIPNHDFVANDYVTISGIGTGFDGVFQITSVTTGASGTIVYTNSSYLSTTVSSASVSPNGTATKNYSTKTELDFESYRVPIISRGVITDNGVNKVVIAAELPTDERFEITEIGVFSAYKNPSSVSNFSKNLIAFTQQEAWQLDTGSSVSALNFITSLSTDSSTINFSTYSSEKAFVANADDAVFGIDNRLNRQERPRFYNGTIFIKGDTSTLTGTTSLTESGATGIKAPISVDLSDSSSVDELRLALSLIDVNGAGANGTVDVKVLVKFIGANSSYASASFYVPAATFIATNRYIVSKINVSNIVTSGAFNWSDVSTVKVFVNAGSSSNFIVALDALRFENKSTSNPLYGMIGYSPIVNYTTISSTNYGRPIVKDSNTQNIIEFRYALDVT